MCLVCTNLTRGFTANTSLVHYCRDNGPLIHIHCTMHAVIDRQKNHGMHFSVPAKALRMSGGDHIHSGIVVIKLEGERYIQLGFVDSIIDDFIEKGSKLWYLFHSRLPYGPETQQRNFPASDQRLVSLLHSSIEAFLSKSAFVAGICGNEGMRGRIRSGL